MSSKNLQEKILELRDIISEKLKNNKSIFYYMVSFFFVFGLLFFINSSRLMGENVKDVRSTEENVMLESSSLQVKLIKRSYDPTQKLIEYFVYANDEQNFDGKELIFQLREQSSPDKSLPLEKISIDDNYYVIRAEVPKKWKVLSLSIGYESDLVTTDDYSSIEYKDTSSDDENTTEDDIVSNIAEGSDKKDVTLSTIIRIYSDSNAINENEELERKSSREYFNEIISLEIGFITNEQDNIRKEISGNLKIIEDAEIKIKELEDNKKYLTEAEKKDTEINIDKLKNLVESKKTINKKYLEKDNELDLKIQKLQQKESDFMS